MATEILGLSEIISSQSQKEVTHNTALRQIEGRTVHAKDKDLTTPPASPVAGDVYIIPSGATGVWAGKTNQVAHFYGGVWNYWVPVEGVELWLDDEDKRYSFTGTAWVVTSGASVIRNLVIQQIVFAFTVNVAVGDGAGYAVVPFPVGGLNLVRVHARVITAGTTGTTDIQIANVTRAFDMLSTKLTIDSAEVGSDTAATPPVINTANDDVAVNDLLRVDVDAVSTTPPKGLIVTLEFAL